QAAAPARDERAIERGARDLVMSVLVRRGLARPPAEAVEERGVGPLFWAGIVASVAGAGAAVGGVVLDIGATSDTAQLVDDAGARSITRDDFDARARNARIQALSGDALA